MHAEFARSAVTTSCPSPTKAPSSVPEAREERHVRRITRREVHGVAERIKEDEPGGAFRI